MTHPKTLEKVIKFITLIVISLLLNFKFTFAQNLKPLIIIVDSTSFPAFKSGDTSFTNYISRDRHINFRQNESRAGTLILEPSQYRIVINDSGLAASKSKFGADSIGFYLLNEQDSMITAISLTNGGSVVTGKYHKFLGKGIILPSRLPVNENQDSIPLGLLYFNSETGGLFTKYEQKDVPAYWEWYDRKTPPNENSIHYGYPDDWIERLNFDEKIPIIRLRNPINVTGVNYTTESEKKDFILAPYEYGILMRYSGVFEADVSQFSIHVGTASEPLDLENNGKSGFGAILWVGDDRDRGGLRATARMRDTVLYSELSSETFDELTHGPIRLRVVDSTDQIQFVQGKRGSTNNMAFIYQSSTGAGLASGGDKSFALGTNQRRKILNLHPNGNAGLGILLPTSKLDIENDEGFNQLRLRKKFTPESTGDIRGKEGDIAWDEDHIYIKTKDGWKRTKLDFF